MWTYERRLEYPVKIKKCDARAAKIIMTQYGGPDFIRYNKIPPKPFTAPGVSFT